MCVCFFRFIRGETVRFAFLDKLKVKMSFDDDNDLSNLLIDGEVSLSSPLNLDISDESKPIIKRSKPSLKCVVCGDNAFGKIQSNVIFFFRFRFFFFFF